MKLKLERVAKGWSQGVLADKANVCRLTISNIERKGIDNIQVKILKKIATALGCSVSELFFSNEE